ncbi:MAG TPA: hypothetical protein VN864_00485 [Thermoplasmata archaeon]|nr:hypothetical protein [Thermoplasmata archaeon]
MSSAATIAIVRCEHCHGRFLPPGGPCPRCGSSELVSGTIPAKATVLAATELLAPAAGWPNPHRLAIVEGAESVRILAIVPGELPAPGAVVGVARVGDRYEVTGPDPERAPSSPRRPRN